MDITTLLLVLREDAEMLHTQIGDMLNICREVHRALDEVGNASQCLLIDSYIPARINGLSSSIESTREKLDISNRSQAYQTEAIQVKQFLVDLVMNLNEMSKALDRTDNILLRKYTNYLQQALSVYHY